MRVWMKTGSKYEEEDTGYRDTQEAELTVQLGGEEELRREESVWVAPRL